MGVMGVIAKSLYDTDFAEWTAETAELLRKRRFDELDLENLIEEIESLGRSQQHAVRSQMQRMLMHLVKQAIQPEREGTSWRLSIVDARREIRGHLEISPSLRRRLEAALQKSYRNAIKDAIDETGLAADPRTLPIPAACPYSLHDLLESELNELSLRRQP